MGGDKPPKPSRARRPAWVAAVTRGDVGARTVERSRRVALLLPVAYVAGAAIYAGETRPGAWLAMAAGALVAFAGGKAREGEAPGARRARLAAWGGLALALAASAWSARAGLAACARELGALVAALAAARSIGAIEGDAGLATRASDAFAAQAFSARLIARLGGAIAATALGSALAIDALVWAGRAPGMERGAPVYAATAAAVALVALGGAAFLTSGARRLELAAPPRALACAAAAGVALFLALGLAVAGTLRADASAVLACALASVVMVRVARVEDVLALARRGRRALTLALFGGPIVTLAALAAEGSADGVVLLVLASAAMFAGALAPKLEEPLLPDKGRLLDALGDAARFAHDRDAREAVSRTLARLREAAGEGAPSPELWMLYPTRVCTVDAAGYLRERDADVQPFAPPPSGAPSPLTAPRASSGAASTASSSGSSAGGRSAAGAAGGDASERAAEQALAKTLLPPLLLEVAAGEPDATLRVEVLRALEVRRPDLRPLLRWLEDRGALFATLISGGEEPDGVLVAPAGGRADPLSIEEVRAAKHLADALVAVCQARSARERHLARERELRERADALDDELARLRHATALDAGRNALAAARLARPATVGIYSAPSRMAYDALERRVEIDAPIVLVARAGVDPVPYLARAHLSGPRKDGPLVIVDGTSSREHDLSRWRDDRASPLALADRGLLVLVDGAALPRDVQVLVARALAERRPPWERATPLDVATALTATRAPELLVEENQLAPELFARFEHAPPIGLPSLRERSEDLFSIVADRLAREGLRVAGKPLGIDAAAFAVLVEHPFDGEDAELAAIVSRLAALAHAEGRDVVRPRDLAAVGLAPPSTGAKTG